MLSTATIRVRFRHAFTLVEVMLVVLIVSILAAAVIGSLTPSAHEQLQSVGEIVVSDLAYARSLATANNSKYTLTFDCRKNQYVLDHTGTNTALESLPLSSFWQPGDSAGQQVMPLASLPVGLPAVSLAGVFKNSAAPTRVDDVEFGPLGGTTRTEDTTVWLGCGAGSERRYLPLLVNPATGLAEIGDFTDTPPSAVLRAEVELLTPVALGN